MVSISKAETRTIAESALADIRDRIGHPNCVAGVMSRIGCGLHLFHGSQHRLEEDTYCIGDDDYVSGGPPVVVTMLVALYISLYTLLVTAPDNVATGEGPGVILSTSRRRPKEKFLSYTGPLNFDPPRRRAAAGHAVCHVCQCVCARASARARARAREKTLVRGGGRFIYHTF